MNINSNVNAETFRQATQLQTQIDALVAQRNGLFGGNGGTPAEAPISRSSAAGSPVAGKRVMSPEAKARISAAQTKRWALIRKSNKVKTGGPAGASKNRFSAAARKRISVAAKARWAKRRADQALAVPQSPTSNA